MAQFGPKCQSNTILFLRCEVVSTSPNPQAGGPHLVGCPRLPIQYIRSYHPYWRTFLHPQPEEVPCRGDRAPLITGEPPLVGSQRMPIQYIRSFPPYLRPFLHPQPEDARCRGDRAPLITGEPPLVGCPRLPIQYIRSYPPYWRPFLHPQPEDAPRTGTHQYCSGDKIEKNQMGGAYSAYGGQKRRIQGFSEEA